MADVIDINELHNNQTPHQNNENLQAKEEDFKKWYKLFLATGIRKGKYPQQAVENALATEADIVAGLLPEYGISKLHNSKTCLICADDSDVRPTHMYAQTDLGHTRETDFPEATIIGSKYGHILPVTIPVCKRCKRNYMLIHLLPSIVALLISLACFLLLCDRNIREPLKEIHAVLPFVIFICVVGLSAMASGLIRRFLLDLLGKKTDFEIFNIPCLRFLRIGGWFKLHVNNDFTRLVFSEELPDYVCCEAEIEASEPEKGEC